MAIVFKFEKGSTCRFMSLKLGEVQEYISLHDEGRDTDCKDDGSRKKTMMHTLLVLGGGRF